MSLGPGHACPPHRMKIYNVLLTHQQKQEKHNFPGRATNGKAPIDLMQNTQVFVSDAAGYISMQVSPFPSAFRGWLEPFHPSVNTHRYLIYILICSQPGVQQKVVSVVT